MFVEKSTPRGVSAQAEVIIKDSGRQPEKAVSFAKQLIEKTRSGHHRPVTSGETMQIKALCEENKVPLVSCAPPKPSSTRWQKYVFKRAKGQPDGDVDLPHDEGAGITSIAVLTGKRRLRKAAKGNWKPWRWNTASPSWLTKSMM